MKRLSALLTISLLGAVPAVVAGQQPAPTADEMSMVRASALQWTALELPGFAPGLMMTVVHGNPEQAQPYTIRLKFPDGYSFPAHFHPNPENLTVLSGKFQLGHGEKPNDASLKEYEPGDYLFIPAKMAHFGRVSGETVVQLHGTGPFSVELAQPKDKTK